LTFTTFTTWLFERSHPMHESCWQGSLNVEEVEIEKQKDGSGIQVSTKGDTGIALAFLAVV